MNPFYNTGFAFIMVIALPLAGRAETVSNDRAKQFIVMGYQGITSELSSGRGPYLNTLVDLLQTSPSQEQQKIDQIRLFSKTYPNIMDFADHVVQGSTDAIPTATLTPSVVPMPLPAGVKIFSGESLENALMHLGKGMKVTVYLKTGEQVKGSVNDYDAKRLWLHTPSVKSFKLDEIQGLEAPDL